ncbi:MAG: hypothetical protein R6V85_10785 [Polyangia bacterium]
MRISIAGWTLLVFCLGLCRAGAVRADESSSERAKRHFNRGTELFDAGEHAEAVAEFREANRIKPTWKLLYSIGQCEALLKRHGRALDAFEAYLSKGGDDVPPDRRQEVLAEIDRLRRLVGALDVSAPDGGRILVDGDPRGTAPLPGRLRVAAGVDHVVELVIDGEAVDRREVRVGGRERIEVVLGPEAAEPTSVDAGRGEVESESDPEGGGPADRSDDLRILGWVSIGMGSALLAGGAVTGGLALSLDSDLESDCSANGCPPDRHDDLDRRDALALTTDVLLGVGAAAAVTGVLLLTVFSGGAETRPEAEGSLALTPTVLETGGGLSLRGRF